MLQSFTKKYTDLSTEDEFAFIFYCDVCDKAWKSVPIPFSQRERKSFFKKLFGVYTSLWNAEHKDAFERANREGMLHFNRCTVCNRWVCDDDFSEEENCCAYCCQRNGSIK
ncbi:MAG: hypothetical protein ACOX1J_09750 [Dethiobacteria bacterium]|jgi:hypothetical protein